MAEIPHVVVIPLDPENLNRILMALGFEGQVKYPTARASWVCPAGKVTEVTFYLEKGWNCVSTHMTISSDYYDPNIIVEVFADGKPVTPWGVTLVSEVPISYGSYFVKRKSVTIRVTNNTDKDIMVSELCYGVMVHDELLENFYLPLFRGVREILQALAEKYRG